MADPIISGIRIRLLDPLKVVQSSKGEVLLSKAFNARSTMPYVDGLFCMRIFGSDNGICLCNTYHSGYRRKPIKCQTCGVTMQSPRLNRERFGHIVLDEPAVHVWFRSPIATLLNIPPRKLAAIIECRAYVASEKDENRQMKFNIISANKAYAVQKEGCNKPLRYETGARAILNLLSSLNLKSLYEELRERADSRRVSRRLQIVRNLLQSDNKPHWMVLQIIPVMPVGLRPTLFMQDGTETTADINELYLKVIRKNNRLKQLKLYNAPTIILDNEKRALQFAVDALLDNGRTNTVKDRSNKKVMKSLSDLIEKKTGRMRRNLLGKRVDYSGRSVIAVGPTLMLHECALPLDLAVRLFKPFVYHRLIRMRLAINLSEAHLLLKRRTPEALDALAMEMGTKYVLLNRAPSLHRMSIQAFKPRLIKEKAILLHPLVCSAFNADFDGDQMGVHLPLTREAQNEARELICTSANIFSPANGKLVVSPAQDIVLGIYYLTLRRKGRMGQGMIFSDKDDVLSALDHQVVELHSEVKVRIDEERIDTTPGRVILSTLFPQEMPFALFNKPVRKKDLGTLLAKCFEIVGRRGIVEIIDAVKNIGFHYATVAGISLCSADITVPECKETVIKEAEARIVEITEEYRNGIRTETERFNLVKDTWLAATDKIKSQIIENLGVEKGEVLTDEQKNDRRAFNSLYIMADSGARGSVGQISQAAGMRGLMTKPTGEVVEMPIKSNLKEGLSYHEFLLACHGARKGRADGALKTATAGYFTRRLVEAAIDVVITGKDCQGQGGFEISSLINNDSVVIPLEERLSGRVLAQDVKDAAGTVIAKANTLLGKGMARKIAEGEPGRVIVRSPLTCEANQGICAMCFGEDLSKRSIVRTGEGVGIIAAQSIGEPGTQLTLRTFHSGGSAGGGTKKTAITASDDCTVRVIDAVTVTDRTGKKVVVNKHGRISFIKGGKEKEAGKLPYGAVLLVADGAAVDAGTVVARWETLNVPTIALDSGIADYRGILEGRTMMIAADEKTGVDEKTITAIVSDSVPRITVAGRDYYLPVGAVIVVEDGSEVRPGDILAKLPSQKEKSSDITQGLGRVIELFENRSIKNAAIIAEVDGVIIIHAPSGGKLKMELIGDGYTAQYSAAVDRHINYMSGDQVKAGDVLVDGVIHANDLLATLGMNAAARYIIDEIQKVYREQGVDIDDKHFEIIVSQMFKTVEITHAGDTDFIASERVLKKTFLRTNRDLQVGRKATARQMLLGLTKVSLASESWLSAASFQNTADILTTAAIKGQTDTLVGIKENVITGGKVPIGVAAGKITSKGLDEYRKNVEETLRLYIEGVT